MFELWVEGTLLNLYTDGELTVFAWLCGLCPLNCGPSWLAVILISVSNWCNTNKNVLSSPWVIYSSLFWLFMRVFIARTLGHITSLHRLVFCLTWLGQQILLLSCDPACWHIWHMPSWIAELFVCSSAVPCKHGVGKMLISSLLCGLLKGKK